MAEPEVWLRGPLREFPAYLMPVAHSLLQSREEVREALSEISQRALWLRIGDSAAAGFHVRHAMGALDRLFTYARGESLNEEQLLAINSERAANTPPNTPQLLTLAFDDAIDRALAQLRATDPATLLDAREVGREKLPSNVIGLLVHAAEHTQRHVGQMVTLARAASAPELQ